jgi:hypothetical protein
VKNWAKYAIIWSLLYTGSRDMVVERCLLGTLALLNGQGCSGAAPGGQA